MLHYVGRYLCVLDELVEDLVQFVFVSDDSKHFRLMHKRRVEDRPHIPHQLAGHLGLEATQVLLPPPRYQLWNVPDLVQLTLVHVPDGLVVRGVRLVHTEEKIDGVLPVRVTNIVSKVSLHRGYHLTYPRKELILLPNRVLMRNTPTILQRYRVAHLIEHVIQMVQQLIVL